MNESCETEAPRKRHGLWVALGVAALLAAFLYWISRPRYFHHGGITTKAKTDITAIVASLDEYSINNNGAYPTSLAPLVSPDANGHCYLEGYNGKIPLDPWKRPYHYEIPTSAYPRPHVWTYGADGRLGGTGENADTDSEEMRERG